MAGTVMHLVIADRLLDALGIRDPALFYCGNLAPDAIMARENYVREMKNHTHFKDGMKPYTFRCEGNRSVYMARFTAFARAFLRQDDPQYELYLGYVVHMLVDELFLLDYYDDFLQALVRTGRHPADPDFSRSFVCDVDQVDWELARTWPFRHPMPDTLLQRDGYDIPGWITACEISASKRFIIDRDFVQVHEKQPLQVTTWEKNRAFIEHCVETVPALLKARFNIPAGAAPGPDRNPQR